MVRTLGIRVGMGALAVAGAAAAVLAFLGLPGASAQGFPPDTPMVLYGDVGGQAGQGVHALVNNGGVWTYCGSGAVVNNGSGGVGFVVQVASQTQTAGCGASGRTIRLYFSPSAYGQPGRFATQTFNWVGTAGVATSQNATLGEGLEMRGVVPSLAAKVG